MILSVIFLSKFISGVYIDDLYTAFVVALLWSLVNIFVKPILTFLTLPIQVITLGLASVLINAALFMFLASFVEGFRVDGFFPAFYSVLILSLINTFINIIKRK